LVDIDSSRAGTLHEAGHIRQQDLGSPDLNQQGEQVTIY
jgi:hypothetical protein